MAAGYDSKGCMDHRDRTDQEEPHNSSCMDHRDHMDLEPNSKGCRGRRGHSLATFFWAVRLHLRRTQRNSQKGNRAHSRIAF